MKNILVTGAGALLGQGILRCLNFSKNKYNVISADPDVLSTGHALANKCYKIPFVGSDSYIKRIEEIIIEESIHLILIGTDVELPIFAKEKSYLESRYNLKVIVSDTSVINISNNKWLTAEFLKNNNFPYPFSALTTDKNKISFLKNNSKYPYIAKPVDGARSKGIELICNEEDLERVCSYENNLVVQEKIDDAKGEFTTGCLVVDGKCVAIVSLTRDLRDGNTWRAYRQGESSYDTKIAEIAEKLGVEGPANFQYRIRDGEPVIFEVNCRFSGTTPLRLIYGFNEVEALVEYYLYNKTITQPILKEGTILRVFSDIFVPNQKLQNFESSGSSVDYGAEFYPFKLRN